MAVKRESRREHNPVQVSSDGASRKADQLAPPEERAGNQALQNSKNEGVMTVPDTGELKLPKEFTEREEERSRFLGLEPVALVILIFALAFIAFIAYLISIEPSKVKDDLGPTTEIQR
jgi:hypothetical protein